MSNLSPEQLNQQRYRANKAYLLTALTALLVFIADQWSKVISKDVYQSSGPRQLGPLEIVSVKNKGIAFGQLDGIGPIIFILVALILTGLIIYLRRHPTQPLIWLASGLIIGGAIGNLFDRLIQGAVHDFLSLSFWPAFNLADASITIGAILLIIIIAISSKPSSPEQDRSKGNQPPANNHPADGQ